MDRAVYNSAMELYLIRHAQSTNNALPAETDRVCDPALTELGQRQAAIVAGHLANGATRDPAGPPGAPAAAPGFGITHLFCSPMWRALQTAQPIGRALGLAPTVWVEMHEAGGVYLDHGPEVGHVGYPGKTRSEILTAFPNYRLPEGITESGWWRNGFEDRAACQQRARRVAAELHRWAERPERIAVVSHGAFLDSLLKALLEQQPNAGFFFFHYNTAITRLDFNADGHLNIRYLNRVDHLPPNLIS